MEAEQIIRLMQEAAKLGLAKVKYQEGDIKLVLENNHQSVEAMSGQQIVGVATGKGAIPIVQNADEVAKNTINSPLVGTFYSAPAEDEPPFVAVGDVVKKGQIVGIIETMKLMNEVESTFDGTVEEILIENEQVVEFGQPLLTIR